MRWRHTTPRCGRRHCYRRPRRRALRALELPRYATWIHSYRFLPGRPVSCSRPVPAATTSATASDRRARLPRAGIAASTMNRSIWVSQVNRNDAMHDAWAASPDAGLSVSDRATVDQLVPPADAGVNQPETRVARDVNPAPRLVPSDVAPATMPRAMRPTIRPYSMAVAPRWVLLWRASCFCMIVTPESAYTLHGSPAIKPDPIRSPSDSGDNSRGAAFFSVMSLVKTFIRHAMYQPYPPFELWLSQLKVGQTFETMQPKLPPSGRFNTNY